VDWRITYAGIKVKSSTKKYSLAYSLRKILIISLNWFLILLNKDRNMDTSLDLYIERIH